MTSLIQMTTLLTILPQAVLDMEITAPEVPNHATDVMPVQTEDLLSAFLELAQNVVRKLFPEIEKCTDICSMIILCIMILSVLNTFSGKIKRIIDLVGTLQISSILLMNTQSMISLASETVNQLSEYGKLLFPVMTAALAAQGGITTSTALYAGTAAFDTVLSNVISKFHVPMVYMFLVLSVAHSATGEVYLKKLFDIVKSIISWTLKIILMVFTTYMSITGVISGTTDAVALKATKVTISTIVPIVGGILSDASEAVLVGAGLMKNSVGMYGMIAILAMFLEPFLKIGIYYITLKLTAMICSVLGTKEIAGLIETFGTAMGMLLGMTGAVCLLLMMSVVCFMRGVG